MILIIVGAILDLFALIGFLAVIGGTVEDPLGVSIVYFVSLILGIGLIFWGIHRRKNKKKKIENQQLSFDNNAQYYQYNLPNQNLQNPNESYGVTSSYNTGVNNQNVDVISLLMFEWKKKWMMYESPITIFVDDMLAGICFFKKDSTFIVPVTQGNHKICIKCSFRSTDLWISTQGNQMYIINIEYSRATGKLNLNNSNMTSNISKDHIINNLNIFNRKMLLLNEVLKFARQRYTVKSFAYADSHAIVKLSRYNNNIYFVLLIILGILPGLIYTFIAMATSKVMIFELTPEMAVICRAEK